MATRKRTGVEVQAVPNHYAVMGLHRSSTAAEIKERYRAMSWDLHPDRGTDGREYAGVTAAYATLKDPALRAGYHARLDVTTVPCASCKGQGCTYKQKGFTQKTASVCGACSGTGRARR